MPGRTDMYNPIGRRRQSDSRQAYSSTLRAIRLAPSTLMMKFLILSSLGIG